MRATISTSHTGHLWRAQMTIDGHTYIALLAKSASAAVRTCAIWFISTYWQAFGIEYDYDYEACGRGRWLVVFFPKEAAIH